jgi:hypothetical protein
MADVLDILPTDYEIFKGEKRENNRLCSISWIGTRSTGKAPESDAVDLDRVDTIYKTRESMKKRILSCQIDFGIILFERGEKSGKDYLTTKEVGSKAWTNKTIKNYKPSSTSKNAFFIDDSNDHIESLKEIMVDVPETEKVIGIIKDTRLEIYTKYKVNPKDLKAIERKKKTVDLEAEIKESFLAKIYEFSN